MDTTLNSILGQQKPQHITAAVKAVLAAQSRILARLALFVTHPHALCIKEPAQVPKHRTPRGFLLNIAGSGLKTLSRLTKQTNRRVRGNSEGLQSTDLIYAKLASRHEQRKQKRLVSLAESSLVRKSQEELYKERVKERKKQEERILAAIRCERKIPMNFQRIRRHQSTYLDLLEDRQKLRQKNMLHKLLEDSINESQQHYYKSRSSKILEEEQAQELSELKTRAQKPALIKHRRDVYAKVVSSVYQPKARLTPAPSPPLRIQRTRALVTYSIAELFKDKTPKPLSRARSESKLSSPKYANYLPELKKERSQKLLSKPVAIPRVDVSANDLSSEDFQRLQKQTVQADKRAKAYEPLTTDPDLAEEVDEAYLCNARAKLALLNSLIQ